MTDFTERINDLQSEIDKLSNDVTGKTASNRIWLISLATPFVIALVLWLWSPSFVMKTKGTVRFDKIRLMIYTILFSMIVWSCLGVYVYYS